MTTDRIGRDLRLELAWHAFHVWHPTLTGPHPSHVWQGFHCASRHRKWRSRYAVIRRRTRTQLLHYLRRNGYSNISHNCIMVMIYMVMIYYMVMMIYMVMVW